MKRMTVKKAAQYIVAVPLGCAVLTGCLLAGEFFFDKFVLLTSFFTFGLSNVFGLAATGAVMGALGGISFGVGPKLTWRTAAGVAGGMLLAGAVTLWTDWFDYVLTEQTVVLALFGGAMLIGPILETAVSKEPFERSHKWHIRWPVAAAGMGAGGTAGWLIGRHFMEDQISAAFWLGFMLIHCLVFAGLRLEIGKKGK
jgi:MFS family permease